MVSPKLRTTISAHAAPALAIAGVLTVVARTTVPQAAVNSSVEDEGTGCATSIPGSLPSNSRLPDPFRRPDGSRITSKADWRCQRAEIKALAERFVYGAKPVKPTVTGTVTSTNITVNVSQSGRSASFSASVSLP